VAKEPVPLNHDVSKNVIGKGVGGLQALQVRRKGVGGLQALQVRKSFEKLIAQRSAA